MTLKYKPEIAELRIIRQDLSVYSSFMRLPLKLWPTTVARMIEQSNKRKAPKHGTLALASDIKLHQAPLMIPTWSWVAEAAKTFAIQIILILQVELTIAWSNIYGLASIASVGQLIPIILGVGGLIKVLWGKGCLIWKKEMMGIRSRGRTREKQMRKGYGLLPPMEGGTEALW
jgi:hypothetical protein